MQEKAANVGFDWDNQDGAWEKLHEEIAEVEAEMKSGNKENCEKEFGDLIFSLVNVARINGINPDNALEQTNAKFRRRFNYVEEESKGQGRSLKDMSLAEMDALWNEAKQKGM
jgi:XTP/dITP diphosphohydrolase